MIGVGVLTYGELEYAELSLRLTIPYCVKHNYKWAVGGAVETEPEEVKRFYRIPLVQQLFKDCEYVLYLDADAYPINHSQAIESLIPLMNGKSMLFADNSTDSEWTHDRDKAQTGIFLAKNDNAAWDILDCWWSYRHSGVTIAAGSDQGAFNDFVLPQFREHVQIVPTKQLGGRDGKFIKHLLMMPNLERECIIRRDLRSLGYGE